MHCLNDMYRPLLSVWPLLVAINGKGVRVRGLAVDLE